VPVVAFPPPTEFTDHVTLLFVLPVTAAAKLAFAPARTVAVAGVTVTLMLVVLSGGKVGEAPLPLLFVPTPAQPLSNKTRIPACALQILFKDMAPLRRRQPTLLRTTAGPAMLFAFSIELLQGVGSSCLGRARVENAPESGYWPRGQNWADDLRLTGMKIEICVGRGEIANRSHAARYCIVRRSGRGRRGAFPGGRNR